MTSIISKSTLESSSYNNIVSFLNDRSIIIDPRDKSGTSKRLFVYDSDPLAKSINFGLFPYIVAEFTALEQSKSSCDGKVKEIEWSMPLTVRTTKDGAGQGTTGAGKTDILSIGDDLQELFNSKTHRQSFIDLNMFFMNLKKEDSDTLPIDQKMVYQSTYSLTFMTRMVISS